MQFSVNRNNKTWSVTVSSAYEAVSRITVGAMLMVQVLAFIIGRKHCMKQPFNLLTHRFIIPGGKMLFLSSLNYPIIIELYEIGRSRIKYARWY